MSEQETFRVGLIQSALDGYDVECSLRKTEKALQDAKDGGAQIVCLQELFASPYFCTVENHDFFGQAESVSGVVVSRMRRKAEELQLVIVCPFFEKRAPGVFHNSAAIIESDGSVLGVFRKMHIPDDPLYYEKFYFTPGDADPGFRVFQTSVAKIGVLICWDQWYPEGARITSLLGAEVLFFPTAIGWHPAEKAEFGESQKQAWETIQRSHAIANGVYVVAVNRTGHEQTPGTEGIEFFGNSFVADPFGRIIERASEDKEEVLIATCQRSLIDQTRVLWPFLRDRRVDAYQRINHRFLD